MRRLVWVVGTLLGVVGAVTTIYTLLRHQHGIGPYLLAAGFLLVFFAALDMWGVERGKVRRSTRLVRRFSARVDRLEDKVHFLEQDRDGWRRMQAEEASANRRLTEELRGARKPLVSGGAAGVASTGPPPPVLTAPPPVVRKPPPRHSRRRPASNQPALFDQDAGDS